TNVYWTDSNNFEVRLCPKATCNMNSGVLASNVSTPVAIVVDAKGIFWADQGSGTDGDISFCPIPGGCPNGPVVLAKDQELPTGIAIDANYVYWTNQGQNDNTGTIMRVAR